MLAELEPATGRIHQLCARRVFCGEAFTDRMRMERREKTKVCGASAGLGGLSLQIRLIAFDMDDTLLGADGKFPDVNIRALQECVARGIKLVLNSGRSFEMLREFADMLNIDPFIASVNGARVDEGMDGPTLLEQTYDKEHTRILNDAMRKSGMYYTVYTRGRTYMANSSQRFLYSRFNHHYAHVVKSGEYVYEMVDDEDRLIAEGLENPYKFVALGSRYDARFAGILRTIEPLKMSISSSRADNMEVMMPGVDKGSALKFLADRLHIPREQVMAFGDNTNDLPMFRYAGASVAVENAEETVLLAADFVAGHHAEGGVGKFLFEKVLQ